MNILLLHSYTRQNKGDAAILSVMIQGLNKRFPGVGLTISTMEDSSVEVEFEGVPQITSLFYAIVYKPGSALTKIVRLFCIPLATFVWAVTYKTVGIKANFLLPNAVSQLMEDLAKADKVVGVGGGYINGVNTLKSTVGLFITLYEFWLAAFFKKEITLYPQSIGPFGNKFQVWAAIRVLNKMQSVLVRERISERLLRSMRVRAKIDHKPDVAFLFTTTEKQTMQRELEASGVSFARPVVGITVRDWLTRKEQDAYELAFAEFTDYLTLEKNMQVVFIPQVTSKLHNDDDREVQERIEKSLKSKKDVWFLVKEYSHTELKGVCENLTFLVGTRMHSVIFSLTSAVPCIAIEYEYKTSGIMQDLGLVEWVELIAKTSFSSLKVAFSKLTSAEVFYKEQISKNLAGYVAIGRNVDYDEKNSSHHQSILSSHGWNGNK